MIPLYHAVQFRGPMERGATRPFKVLATPDSGGEEVLLVVKTIAGYGDSGEAMVRECFATLWAKALGVAVPEPVIVNIPEGFDFAAADYPDLRAIIKRSIGHNFGTVHLGTDWKTWMATLPPKSIKHGPMEAIYAFDGFSQNPDRKMNNPNMLWRGDQVIALDFDRSFSYINTMGGGERPWEQFLPLIGLREHCLNKWMKEPAEQYPLGVDVWIGMEEWRFSQNEHDLASIVSSVLADPTMDLPKITAYISRLAHDPEHFLDCLTHLT